MSDTETAPAADNTAVISEAPDKKSDKGTALRDVNDFLASLDDVLSPPATPANQPPQPTTEDAPAQHQKWGENRWWDEVYRDNEADQDTFTGNPPVSASPAPAQPIHAPNIPATTHIDKDIEKDPPTAGEPAKEAADKNGGRKKQLGGLLKSPGLSVRASVGKRPADGGEGIEGSGSSKKTGTLTQRGRKVLFAGTAAGLGYGLHLDRIPTALMAHADQYATPTTAVLMGAGLVCLALRTKLGGCLFVSSLVGVTVLQMFDPAYVVGGCMALPLQAVYRVAKSWAGKYGRIWPWKGVLWFIHVPAATASLAVIQYGTN